MALLTSSLRKFAFAAHVTASVGWRGAVGSFLGLAVAGPTSKDGQLVRSPYLATDLTTWFVIVPYEVARLVDATNTTAAKPFYTEFESHAVKGGIEIWVPIKA
jgi:hypothetical protein